MTKDRTGNHVYPGDHVVFVDEWDQSFGYAIGGVGRSSMHHDSVLVTGEILAVADATGQDSHWGDQACVSRLGGEDCDPRPGDAKWLFSSAFVRVPKKEPVPKPEHEVKKRWWWPWGWELR